MVPGRMLSAHPGSDRIAARRDDRLDQVLGVWDIMRGWRGLRRRRQARQLAAIRERLAERGVDVEGLNDEDLLALVQSGRRALDAARVPGSDATGAFVVLVRNRNKF